MSRWIVEEPQLEATFTHDPNGGRVYWSPEMCELFGVSPNEFDGTEEDFMRRIHPSDQERLGRGADPCEPEPGRFAAEMRIVRPDGVIRRIRLLGEALEGADGRTVLIAGAAVDVSEVEVRDRQLARTLGLHAAA